MSPQPSPIPPQFDPSKTPGEVELDLFRILLVVLIHLIIVGFILLVVVLLLSL